MQFNKIFCNEDIEEIKNLFGTLISMSNKYLVKEFRPCDIVLYVKDNNIIFKNINSYEYYAGNDIEDCRTFANEFKERMNSMENEENIFTYELDYDITYEIYPDQKDYTIQKFIPSSNYFLIENSKFIPFIIEDNHFYNLLIEVNLTRLQIDKDKELLEAIGKIKDDKLNLFSSIYLCLYYETQNNNSSNDIIYLKKETDKILPFIANLTKLGNNKFKVIYSHESSSIRKIEIYNEKRSITFSILDQDNYALNKDFLTVDIDKNIFQITDLSKMAIAMKKLRSLFLFYKRIDNIKYSYELGVNNFEFKLKIDENLENLIPIEFIDYDIEGKFKTKEYNLLKDILLTEEALNKIEEIKTYDIDIPPGDRLCKNCNTLIKENTGHYYCYWCKFFFCEKCVEDKIKNNKDNTQKYLHKDHNLHYFVTRDKQYLTDLEEYRRGKNRFTEYFNNNDLSFSHNASCTGCDGTLRNTPRYVCLSCKPGCKTDRGYADFCYSCFCKLREDGEEARRIEAVDSGPEKNGRGEIIDFGRYHCHKTHVLLLVICSKDGRSDYYDY